MVCVLSSAISLHSPFLHKSKLSAPLSLRSSLPNAKLTFNPAAKQSSICSNPIRCLTRFGFGSDVSSTLAINKKRRRGLSAVCYAMPLSARNLQWISTISSVILMLARGTGIQKSFIVPLFALQAPASVISWIKGEYGIWSAFLALLVRLFFFIPGELEIPFISLLLVIVAPYQVQNLRGTQEGTIISLLIAAYLAFQHFSRAGSFRRAFDQNSIVATVAIICVTAVSFLLVI
ncbi:cold-regulated 413 inner membrane protein 1, chloroplastic-like isoform X1 [Cucurbita maxima]|uniref:Cold-regulated 413 inner membrane protein 1, chloroplastic-like isoform X1 n=1 Tax=Cucurbita maxima TaxID=3661 RepID=A0A6J1K438_CUCMA|nr:cold-regulated 413 inner membrane protein 1, chloroplastic-like isoform X1 [Cucurbita maxima]XP_022994879.1 cold-regulated 413 inner membrane protein 1, chloroplastic-like isoform X1 [Cucurbita maxima]XP_022994880.1 cold-regulated 413 inner membrane protein 1, chloroplastic-like isoform X1 [Cucurbita maxima]